LKVLQVITGLEAGGAELQLAMLMRRTRHETDVVTLYNPGVVAEQIRAHGTKVSDLGMRRNTQLSAFLRLRKIIKDGGYDVVHAHLYRSQIYARPAAWLAGTSAVVTTEHSIGETHIERRQMTARVRALYLASELFSDATIAVSATVRDRLIRWGVPGRKITVIPNGLEVEELAFSPADRASTRERFGIAPDTYVIGMLGRLDVIKRVDMTIEAAAPLLGDRCKVLIIGGGEDRPRLEAAAARLNVAEHVIFGGYQSDTRAMLSAFDLCVSASSQETFGLSVLEAIASGLPVLYTACPALEGIRTSSARQVEGSASALREEIRKEVEAGPKPRIPDQNVFDQYGAESTARQIDDLYERVIAVRSRNWWRNRARARLTKRLLTEIAPQEAADALAAVRGKPT
jgi:glycosyltransferase involved in cell wall biosynthesis